MRRFWNSLALACALVVTIGCDRATQQAPLQTTIKTQPAVSNVSSESGLSSDTVQVGDPTEMPADTSNRIFATSELKAARDTLETVLSKDQFTSTEAPRSHGKGCLNPLTGKSSNAEIGSVFVRPRILTIWPADSSGEKTLATEVTRLALIRRDANGLWRGVMEITRDTVSWRLQSDGKTGNWAVCELPGHGNGNNSDGSPKAMTAWLPINTANTDIGPKVVWEGSMTWSRLRQLADSISKLPPDFVVEGNPEPKLPIYYRDLCPGEGCSFGQWLACDTVRILKEASAGSPTAFVLHQGDTLTAVTGDVKILQAGKVVFSRVVKVDQEGMHALFTPADTLYPLIHTGEGFGAWYFRGKESGGFFFFGTVDNTAEISTEPVEGYSVVRMAKHEWWVKARTKKGQEGWFMPIGFMPGMSPHYEEGPLACPKIEAKG